MVRVLLILALLATSVHAQTVITADNIPVAAQPFTLYVTSDIATTLPCKYDTSDVSYETMSGTFAGTGTTNHTASLTLSLGSKSYYARCEGDTAEATPSALRINFDVYTDSTAPTVEISTSSPQNISSDALSVSWTSNDAETVIRCKWRIGAAPDDSNGTLATSPASTSGYSIGANTLYVGCEDNSGNWGNDSITVNYSSGVDSTAPTVSITTTDPTTILNTGNLTLTFTDSDNVGVTARRYLVDAQPTPATGTATTASPASISGLRVGTQTLWVCVWDAAGNRACDSIQVTRNHGATRQGVSIVGGGSF